MSSIASMPSMPTMGVKKTGRMSKKTKETLKNMVEKLSEKFGFNRDEGEKLLGLNETKKKGKPIVQLPWTGEVCSDWCEGVRPSHGLYAQCTNSRKKGEDYCKTCLKKEDKHTVHNREEWMSANGKKTKHYGTYMKKKGIDREDADREAGRFGLTIPESEYEEKGTSRGRPRKTAATSDTDDSSSDDEPKKRGRPQKEAPKQDMFAELVAENAAAENVAEEAEWQQWKETEEADAKLKAEEEAEQAKLKEEKETKKAEKAKLKETKKAEKAKLKAEKEKQKAEKAKLKAEREADRELRRAAKEAKKVAKEAKKLAKEEPEAAKEEPEAAKDEPEAAKDEPEAVTERKQKTAALFGTDTEDGELEEEEYGNEADVNRWEHSGVKYLLNEKTGDVYDIKTQEHIGIWNGTEIEDVVSGSDTEDSD